MWTDSPGDFAEGDVTCQHGECGNAQQASLRFIQDNLKLILILFVLNESKYLQGHHYPFITPRFLLRGIEEFVRTSLAYWGGSRLWRRQWLAAIEGRFLLVSRSERALWRKHERWISTVEARDIVDSIGDTGDTCISIHIFISIPCPDWNLVRWMSRWFNSF